MPDSSIASVFVGGMISAGFAWFLVEMGVRWLVEGSQSDPEPTHE